MVQGTDGFGDRLTPQQIKTALKINQMAAERETEFEQIARQLGLDIEHQAQLLVAAPSPKGSRQVVRQVRQPEQSSFPTTFGTQLFKTGPFIRTLEVKVPTPHISVAGQISAVKESQNSSQVSRIEAKEEKKIEIPETVDLGAILKNLDRDKTQTSNKDKKMTLPTFTGV